MLNIISDCVNEYLKGSDKIKDVAGLYGDASYRRYFRVYLETGKSFIVMKMPVGKSSASEEITNFKGVKDELPFINVATYLSGIGLPVAKVFHYDKGRETLILEDLGDDLLFGFVDTADDSVRHEWYKRALDLLVDMQKKAKDDGKCIAFKRSFDDVLLNWEFDHFLEYGIEARLNTKVDGVFKKKFEEITRDITKKIVGLRKSFIHRDYQSRNLIVKSDKIFIIDFQDALMGPYTYDLVALLRDSYVSLSDELLDKLVDHYCAKTNINKETFMHDFDLVTIQRKLKDAGRFVYIDRVKGNPNFLKHIPNSLEYVRKAIARRPEYQELFDLARPYVEEWK